MDVELYVYDLSRGLARQMSRQFLGIQIDAVYHTSLVFGGVEYFFGLGVQTTSPGSTHHGRPMEVVPMGQTSLPIGLILEYLESLRETYTAESYDLFSHNCNNFTHDFAIFLVGHGIPEHITSLPRTVLETPFGQMLRPQIDSAMRAMTQAPIAPQSRFVNGTGPSRAALSNGTGPRQASGPTSGANPAVQDDRESSGEVYNVTTLERLNLLLKKAELSSAVIFFTSATCAPCRLVYPTFDELAAETGGKCFLIKVDISNAREIASRYNVRATPTFISFLKGKEENTWTGANPAQLKGSIRILVQSAFPPHAHEQLTLPTFRRQSTKPIIYNKIPPLDKLSVKLGSLSSDHGMQEALSFIKARQSQKTPQNIPIPDLPVVSTSLTSALDILPLEVRFVAIDILRLILIDPRISSYYLTSPINLATLTILLSKVVDLAASGDCPYSLRLTALHAACNISSSNPHILIDSGALSDPAFAAALTALVSAALLDTEHSTLRVAAASLAYNLATAEMCARIRRAETGAQLLTDGDSGTSRGLAEAGQVELAASLIEALGAEEESKEAIKLMALALGRLVYLLPYEDVEGEEVLDLCRAMEAGEVVARKGSMVETADRVLLHEIGVELLGKGLRESAS